MTTRPDVTAIRSKLRKAVDASGLTLEEIGIKMGFAASGAAQAVSRLLNPKIDYDPRLSTLLAFAHAINRRLSDLL